MSNLKVNTITDASGGNTTAINGMTPTAESLRGFRNRIINGDMRIDQRNAGASVGFAGTGIYPVDRFVGGIQQGSGHTAQRSTIAPAGFTNSLLITVGTGAAASANSLARIYQGIEGFNTADFGWGTANAQTITLSFWVRSSLTGTFGGGLYNQAANQTYVFTYTINAANTWEYKTVTVPGNTTGTWTTDNTGGIYVNWDLGSGSDWQGTAGSWAAGASWATSGSVKLAATSGATWQITGVQLEAGSVATPFERVEYGESLRRCSRYFYSTGGDAVFQFFGTGQAFSTSQVNGIVVPFPVTMRSIPTFSVSATADFVLQNSAGSGGVVSAISQDASEASNKSGNIRATRSAAGLTGGNAVLLFSNNTTSARLNWSSEL